jgi:hypothetical protein
MSNAIYPAFEAAIAEQTQQWVAPYEAIQADSAHQFVLFLKPEATAVHEGVDVAAIIKMVFERLTSFETTVHAIRVLPAKYLKDHSIMDQHYGVINNISKNGESALTDAAREKLHTLFADEIADGAIIMGGHQFLDICPDISPLALSTMNDNVGTTKLGGGSYCMKLNVLGQVYLLLNPFHAYQLVPFTTGDRAIIVLECRSNQDWKVLRGNLTGSTNPATAAEGSIRAELLARKDEFNLKDVNQGSNGIHLSAGPLEGMVELQRFFTDHESDHALDWNEIQFGAQLAEAGKSADEICVLAGNANVDYQSESVSAFDLTEEINADESLRRLS